MAMLVNEPFPGEGSISLDSSASRKNKARLLLLVDVCQVNIGDVAPAGAAGTSSGHLLLRWLRVYFYF